ncbi:AfsA-related hotdog domain-containing protein [Streptomyces albidus (ex Kaewkla and Franco 2022)]|uniref:AfsA-related hotdog domain-containing protein n=1 Tax=Streptomyces albidus (ex Kaewkla and Franco 2022) TaxID=722709 RepID=UPI0015EEC24D|nr:AfsA-related hotdog domain-containing protein [Streptomyces albidus (ex Kaewkla and Franco 2022)]
MSIVPRPTVRPRSSAVPAPSLLGPHHLVHRPDTPEGFLLQSTPPVRQQFAFSAELPQDHPLFCDGTAAFHDLLFPLESLRQTAVFAARRCFRIPGNRHMVLTSGTTDVTDTEPWRRRSGSSQIALDLGITPMDVVNGVPHSLSCRAAVSIDGQPCGTAEARIAFPTPLVYRHHWNKGRMESTTSLPGNDGGSSEARIVVEGRLPGQVPAQRPALTAHRSPAPERVGRRSARNVLIGLPVQAPQEEGTRHENETAAGLTFPVDLPTAGEVLPDATDAFTTALLVEASRQSALFAATELYGFAPAHALLSHWQASFRGFAEKGLPLLCTVRTDVKDPAGDLPRDSSGRPYATLMLSFTQGSRLVSEASVRVLQDC